MPCGCKKKHQVMPVQSPAKITLTEDKLQPKPFESTQPTLLPPPIQQPPEPKTAEQIIEKLNTILNP